MLRRFSSSVGIICGLLPFSNCPALPGRWPWLAICGQSAPAGQLTGYADVAELVCRLQDRRISEVSGIAASRLNPGCYYVHNDSGDQPRVYLIDQAGQTRLTVYLRGAGALDYEDIAVGPGGQPGTFDVYVADIGDNLARRPYVTIYRFAEPRLADQPRQSAEVQPVAYRFRYADGPVDAEALAIHPRTGDGYIFTKRWEGGSAVYKLPAPWDSTRETVVAKLPAFDIPGGLPPTRVVTAADISPDGSRLAVRCVFGGWEWRLPPETADPDFDRIFQTNPLNLPLPVERQGEAICYSTDGRTILTIGEGVPAELHALRMTSPDSQPTR